MSRPKHGLQTKGETAGRANWRLQWYVHRETLQWHEMQYCCVGRLPTTAPTNSKYTTHRMSYCFMLQNRKKWTIVSMVKNFKFCYKLPELCQQLKVALFDFFNQYSVTLHCNKSASSTRWSCWSTRLSTTQCHVTLGHSFVLLTYPVGAHFALLSLTAWQWPLFIYHSQQQCISACHPEDLEQFAGHHIFYKPLYLQPPMENFFD